MPTDDPELTDPEPVELPTEIFVEPVLLLPRDPLDAFELDAPEAPVLLLPVPAETFVLEPFVTPPALPPPIAVPELLLPVPASPAVVPFPVCSDDELSEEVFCDEVFCEDELFSDAPPAPALLDPLCAAELPEVPAPPAPAEPPAKALPPDFPVTSCAALVACILENANVPPSKSTKASVTNAPMRTARVREIRFASERGSASAMSELYPDSNVRTCSERPDAPDLR